MDYCNHQHDHFLIIMNHLKLDSQDFSKLNYNRNQKIFQHLYNKIKMLLKYFQNCKKCNQLEVRVNQDQFGFNLMNNFCQHLQNMIIHMMRCNSL